MNENLNRFLSILYRENIIKNAKQEGISKQGVYYLEREQLNKYDKIYIKEINCIKYGFVK